jgi:hypothetical protein
MIAVINKITEIIAKAEPILLDERTLQTPYRGQSPGF